MLTNLASYCTLVKDSQADANADRKKVFVVSKQRSHADEIEERLQFLKYFATQSDFEFKKVQLRVIYDSLSVQSPIKQDQNEFLIWCKNCCAESGVLDLNEMGEYFSELMAENKLDIESLSVVGFEFLQNYVISVNQNQSNLLKLPAKQKASKNTHAGVVWNSYYMSSYVDDTKEESEDEDQDTNFNVLIDPSKLVKIDMIWTIVRFAQNPTVVKRSIDLLIKIHTQLHDDLNDRKGEFAQLLIDDCIKALKKPTVTPNEVKRMVQILKQMIEFSERKGTGDIQPHSAILRGEVFTRILIKNNVKAFFPNMYVRVYSSATVWEFVDKVSRMCEIAPQYADITLQGGKSIKTSDYGKTVGEIGMKNNDMISIRQNSFKDEGIEEADPVDHVNNCLTPAAYAIIDEWYSRYSDKTGVMTPESTTRFILGATGEHIGPTDGRIEGLFKGYDSNKDGKLERNEFLTFYTNAAIEKASRVMENIKAHCVRPDLVRFCDVYEKTLFPSD